MDAKRSEKSIDWGLSIKLANNKPELAKELLGLLMDDLPKIQEIINQAYQNQDYSLMHQQIHKLHGATCYCGVPKLKEIAATFESKLKKNDRQIFTTLIKKLNQEIENLLFEFKQNNYQNV